MTTAETPTPTQPDAPVEPDSPGPAEPGATETPEPAAEPETATETADEPAEEPADDRVHDAVNDEFSNPKTVLDDAPRQPPSVPAEDPLVSRCPGETYDDYLVRAASFGAQPLDQADWEQLPG